MVDIQSAAATPLSTGTAAASTATAGLNAIQVAIADISQSLQDLSHTVQTSATPVALSNNGSSLTLATTLGNITVSLASLGALEKVSLTQQLMNMIQSQRPLTLTLQAGTPPTQAVLLVPAPSSVSQSAVAPTALPTPPITPLGGGEILPAVVLPSAQTLPPPIPTSASISQSETPPALPSAIALPSQSSAPEPLATASSNLGAASTSSSPTSVAAPASSAPLSASLQTIVGPASGAESNAPTAALSLSPTTSSSAVVPSALPPVVPPSPTSPTPLNALLQPGNELTLQVETVIAPPTAAALPAPPVLASNQILATVVSTGSDGNMILNSGNTNIFVKAPVTAPVGTTVILTVSAAKLPPPVTLPLAEIRNFPALPQALAALAQNAPQVLQQIMNNVLPQPTPVLPGALMFLFNAFKQGNLRSWLGDDATDSLLHMGKADLVASLTRELSDAGQSAQDPVVGEWRSYPIPLYAQQQFQALTLHVHSERDARQNKRDDADSAPTKIRFLIDMRLSKLGAMQVDGFVQPKKLDMILRSETTLPEGLHNELRSSYIRAMGAVGYTGTLNFQVGRRHWMMMQQSSPPGVVT